MKSIILILLSLSSSLLLFSQKNTNENKFKNTEWECNLSKRRVTYLHFKSDNKVLFYNCDVVSTCTYLFHYDTLFILENCISEGDVLELWRYSFRLFKNKLYPILAEKLINKKWNIVIGKFDKDYFFIEKLKKQ